MKPTASDIETHKKLIENTYDTKVTFVETQQLNTGWIVYSDNDYVYKTWYYKNTIGQSLNEVHKEFYAYHKSKMLVDYRTFKPYGCIMKLVKMPGIPLRYVDHKTRIKINLDNFIEWWIKETVHIHEVGLKLSSVSEKFQFPKYSTTKSLMFSNGYVFCFADLNDENIMYDEKSDTFNFIDFEPIGWMPRDMYWCLNDAHLILLLENTFDCNYASKYLDSVSSELKRRLELVR